MEASHITTPATGLFMVSIFMLLLVLGFAVFMLGAYWRVFEKTGRPGWYALIPFWNIYQMVKMAGMSGWSMLLLLVPFVNLFYLVGLNIRIARSFGQSSGFGIGLALLGFIFWPILGYGDAQYQDHESFGENEDNTPPASNGHRNEQGDWVEEVPLDEW